MNSDLELFQKDFINSIISYKSSNDLISNIIPAKALNTAQEVLDVHAFGIIARLTEALGETYSSTWWNIGDEAFFSVCEKYIKENPSKFYNLSDYGNNFEKYLEKLPIYKEIPFLTELVIFERTFKNIFHQKSGTSISNEDLSEKIQNNEILNISKCLYIQTCKYNILPIWKLREKDQNSLQKDELDLLINYKKEVILLFYKKNSKIFIKDINLLQSSFIKKLQNGLKVLEVIESFDDISSEEIQEIFFFLASSGIVEI